MERVGSKWTDLAVRCLYNAVGGFIIGTGSFVFCASYRWSINTNLHETRAAIKHEIRGVMNPRSFIVRRTNDRCIGVENSCGVHAFIKSHRCRE
jgi:hypothetical protein